MAEWVWDEKDQRWKKREEVEEEEKLAARKQKQLQDIGMIIDAVISYITSNYDIKFDPTTQSIIITKTKKVKRQ